MRRALALAVVLASLGPAALAQKPEPIELGFKPEKVYDFGGIDNVNVFNGNVIVNIPLGLRYGRTSTFRYGLTLVYNSKVWDYWEMQDAFDSDRKYEWAKPNLRSNAGPGWRVSLGRLLAPTGSTSTAAGESRMGWAYESPAGDEHAFGSNVYDGAAQAAPDAEVQFTSDGSYLRMIRLGTTLRQIEFPDGQRHTFRFERGAWRLIAMRDRFSHAVNLSYTYWSTSDDRVTQWTILESGPDAPGRAHSVWFTYQNAMGDSIDRGMTVSSIDLQGMPDALGQSRTYTIAFTYTPTAVTHGCYHTYTSPPVSGAPQGTTTTLPLLTRVSLPDGTSYGLSYFASGTDCSQGLLSRLTLPTFGSIAYTYQLYTLQGGGCIPEGPHNSSPGVRTRSLDGNVRTYLLTTGPAVTAVNNPPTVPLDCGTGPDNDPIPPIPSRRWNRTSILSPADAFGNRSRTDSYFNLWSAPDGGSDPSLGAHNTDFFGSGEASTAGWPGEARAKFAPPAYESASDVTATDDGISASPTNRSLSEQIWSGCTSSGSCTTLLRSTYRRFVSPPLGSNAGRNAISERTLFHDDAGCNGICYVQSDSADFDRVGHFRDTSTRSNFPGFTNASSHTGYRVWTTPELYSLSSAWTLTRYTDQARIIGTQTAKTTHCFDDNGLLLRQRVLAGSTEQPHDLITAFEHAGGNVVSMSSYGGDGGNAGVSSDLCSVSPGTRRYKNRYTWSPAGVLATSTSVYDDPATPAVEDYDLPFHSLDYSSDAATGLVTASRGTDGLATTYDYEAWGRLRSITPPGEVQTTLTVTNATSTTAATIVARRDPLPGSSSDDVTITHEYDGLGRLTATRRQLPGAGCVEQTVTYDALGRKATESVPKLCGTTAGAISFQYDVLGRVTRTTAPDGKVATVAYTGAREVRRTAEVGLAQVTTREEYDVFGRLASVTENFGADDAVTTTYGYDAGDRLTSVQMPGPGSTQTRAFTYDNRGLLLSEGHPELGAGGYGTSSYVYDARGHVTRKTTGAFDITMEYDPAERLSLVKETFSGRVLEQYVYDAFGACDGMPCQGKLAAAARWHYDANLGNVPITVSYQYDSATGRVGRRDATVGSTATFTGASFFLTRNYNELGEVSSLGYPCRAANCSASDPVPFVLNGYTNGALTSVNEYAFTESPGSFVHVASLASAMSYHPSGTIHTVTHGSASSRVLERWTADPSGLARPGAITASSAAGATLWSSGDYSYDGSGNIVSIGSTAYRYDARQRLTGWTVTQPANACGTPYSSANVGYDTFGNQLFSYEEGCGYTPECRLVCAGPSFLPAALTGTTNHYSALSYDAAGNVTDDGRRSFTYDSMGLLTRTVADGRDFRYFYLPGGERIAIVERLGSANAATFTIRGFANELLSVWKRDTAGVLRWTEDLIWRGNSLLADVTPEGRRHYSLDHLGSPRLVSAASNGLTLGTQSFAPFGSGGTSDGGALQFTGHERDAGFVGGGSVDLPDYMHARFYDLSVGRFLSVDPGRDWEPEQPQSWNRYTYVENNPLRFTDPSGKYVCNGTAGECRTVETSLQLMKESAANLKKSDPQKKELQNVIAAYGKQGDPATKISNVWVNPKRPDGSALLGPHTLGQAGREGNLFLSTRNIGAKALGDSEKAFTILGGVMTHEGKHELQPGVVGLPIGAKPSLLALLHYETQAFIIQETYYRGLGKSSMAPDPVKGAWSSANQACEQVGCVP